MGKMSEEPTLTQVQRMAKAALDAELEKRKQQLRAELAALESIDTQTIASRIGESVVGAKEVKE